MDHVRAVSERIDEFPENTNLVLAMFSAPGNLDSYAEPSGFTILIDQERNAYSDYGLGRGSIPTIYGLNTIRGYLGLFARRGLRDVRRPSEDTLQLGGDFVIDPKGVLRYGHWATGPNDRPDINELLQAAKSSTQ